MSEISAESVLQPTPWNTRAIGVPCFEILSANDDVLRDLVPKLAPGNYTVRIDPLASKRTLHELGFYYCDTSIEGLLTPERLIAHRTEGVSLSENAAVDDLLAIANRAFTNSHYHRDFEVERARADDRFNFWVRDIHASGDYFAVFFESRVAGFFAFRGEAFILQAMGAEYRGRGLGKACWTLACRELFARGCRSLASPMSTSNLAIINLHIAMGFRFHKVEDLYHLVIK